MSSRPSNRLKKSPWNLLLLVPLLMLVTPWYNSIDPTLGGTPARDQRYIEVFTPPYLLRGPRPHITGTPASVTWSASFNIQSADAARVASVALLRPCAMTHHTDAGQRYIKLPITGHTPTQVTVTAPATSTLAPPGYYMVFVVDADGVPSEAAWIRITP
jgi:hypothetical protein